MVCFGSAIVEAVSSCRTQRADFEESGLRRCQSRDTSGLDVAVVGIIFYRAWFAAALSEEHLSENNKYYKQP